MLLLKKGMVYCLNYYPSFAGVLCLSLLWCSLFCFHSSFAIILKRKRELVSLLLLSYKCIVTINDMLLFPMVPWVGLQCVIVIILTYFLGTKMYYWNLELSTWDPLKYKMGKSVLIVSIYSIHVHIQSCICENQYEWKGLRYKNECYQVCTLNPNWLGMRRLVRVRLPFSRFPKTWADLMWHISVAGNDAFMW